MNINIVLPSVLWQQSFLDDELEATLNNLNINKLIKYSSISKCNFNYTDIIYQPLFDNNEQESLALNLAYQLAINNQYKSFLLARPIHLIASNNSLYIDHNSIIDLNDFELKTIVQAVNNHFKDELKVFEIKPNLLLIAFSNCTNINSSKNKPPIMMINEHIYSEDIKLLNDTTLLRLNNEIQMLLFNLELNKIRLNQKKLPINSLWLYDYHKNNDLNLYQIINNQTVCYSNLNNYHLEQIHTNHTFFIESIDKYNLYNSTDPIKWLDIIYHYDKILFRDIFNLFNNKKINLINIFIPKAQYTIKIRIKNSINLLPWKKNNFYSIFKDIVNEI
jgi:hypothetical protein